MPRAHQELFPPQVLLHSTLRVLCKNTWGGHNLRCALDIGPQLVIIILRRVFPFVVTEDTISNVFPASFWSRTQQFCVTSTQQF